MSKASYDQRCYDLGEIFLSDRERKPTPAELDDLASTIQQAIEDWMEDQDRSEETRRDNAIDRKIDERGFF